MKKNTALIFLISFLSFFVLFFALQYFVGGVSYDRNEENLKVNAEGNKGKQEQVVLPLPLLDKVVYDKKLLDIANNPPDPIVYENIKTVETDKNGKSITKITKVPVSPQPVKSHLWPVKAVYPNGGALLPFNRIIAYYGNLYSKKMGVLGEYPENEMLRMLETEVKKWEIADPNTPVIPALHYIAVVAQSSAGADGKYRARMPDSEIDKVLTMAKKIDTIVFFDIQVGFSDLKTEVPYFSKYLKLPNVHLGVDPEFSMKTGARPGKVVGTLDASDINFTAEYFERLVRENNLPPKILVVHRYTQNMLTNYKLIKPLPEVQIVIHMDGWGEKAKKINTYRQFIYPEPVQFTGFKLFYKNDIFNPNTVLMTPADLLKLSPQPVYIQ